MPIRKTKCENNLIFYFFLQADNSLTKLHHHVTGVLCHSLQKAYAFTWTDQFSSNCNVTLNCLMTVLDDVAKVIFTFFRFSVLFISQKLRVNRTAWISIFTFFKEKLTVLNKTWCDMIFQYSIHVILQFLKPSFFLPFKHSNLVKSVKHTGYQQFLPQTECMLLCHKHFVYLKTFNINFGLLPLFCPVLSYLPSNNVQNWTNNHIRIIIWSFLLKTILLKWLMMSNLAYEMLQW